jgi:hypothetical protein
VDQPKEARLRLTGFVPRGQSYLRALGVAVGLTLFTALAAGAAPAQTVVVPNGLTSIEGNTSNIFPFQTPGPIPPSQRYQQVFAASEFAALSGPSLITEIAVRPDAQFGTTFTVMINAIQINLSTTGAAPDALSLTFADNIGADDTIVFSGSLSLTSGLTGPPAGPKEFDYVIPLQTPFLYDPAAGNLLLDVRNLSGALAFTSFDAQISGGDSVSRVFSNPFLSPPQDVTSPTGFADTLGLVVRFTAVPAEIPVAIDIKPGNLLNSMNPSSQGVIPVAILTTDSFDAATVDATTVLFGPSGTEAAPVHSALEDVDGDGDIDMILLFNTQETGIQCGDTSASLTGHTSGGEAIRGSDSVNTAKCN